jgi:hypothetical protein
MTEHPPASTKSSVQTPIHKKKKKINVTNTTEASFMPSECVPLHLAKETTTLKSCAVFLGTSVFLKPFSDASKVEIYFFVLQEKRNRK